MTKCAAASGISEEDIGGRGKAHRAADAERALQQPGHAAHHRRQHPPVEQQRGQHAHDQHDGQRLERQNKIRAGHFRIERQRSPAEIAEHEGGAGARGRRNGADRVVDHAKGMAHERQFYQHDRGQDSYDQADRRLSQRYRAAVLAKCPGQRQQGDNTEPRL
jgi:hypothetical protein